MAAENMAIQTVIAQETGFGFGKNWSSFLQLLDESRIQEAGCSALRHGA